MELVFEDISTFDAKNPIAGSLLREIDLSKKKTDSEFIKSLPSHPGKEFEIQKRLDRLRGIDRYDNNNNKNNNNDDGDGGVGGDFFGLDPTAPQNKNISSIPGVFNINEILSLLLEEYDVQQRLNQQVPEVDDLLQQRLNSLRGISDPTPQVRQEEMPFLLTTPLIFIFLLRSQILIRFGEQIRQGGGEGVGGSWKRLAWFSRCDCNQKRKS